MWKLNSSGSEVSDIKVKKYAFKTISPKNGYFVHSTVMKQGLMTKKLGKR